MPEIKVLTAKKTLKLDCGCIIQAHQSFMVTRIFACPKATAELLSLMTAPHAKHEPTEVSKPQEQAPKNQA